MLATTSIFLMEHFLMYKYHINILILHYFFLKIIRLLKQLKHYNFFTNNSLSYLSY
jgi:hypothetical protein